MNNKCWFDFSLSIEAELDKQFRPASLFKRNFSVQLRRLPAAERVIIAIERENGLVARIEEVVFPDQEQWRALNRFYLERIVKFLLWAKGGWRIFFSGPCYLGEYLQQIYSQVGARKFDVELMTRVYERAFEVRLVSESQVPASYEQALKLAGSWDGCRVGFDLGASDYKVVALHNGQEVYSNELPWNPKDQSDPEYHYSQIRSALQLAASKLPCLDAIGGSSAGVIVDNRVMVASLFRSVPQDRFDREVKDIFLRLGRDFGVPIVVVNDGDVTALAGALNSGENGILGVAMGSSQAAGYIDRGGQVSGGLNELAFAPIDYNSAAAVDEWSGDRGVGVMYFSQQAVNRLLNQAGIEVAAQAGLPERLANVQDLISLGDERAAKIYQTIGVYLGYAVPHYAQFYDIQQVLVLGRVTSGRGGEIITQTARRILQSDFPELGEKLSIALPDEKSRRIGQARAAASLPSLS